MLTWQVVIGLFRGFLSGIATNWKELVIAGLLIVSYNLNESVNELEGQVGNLTTALHDCNASKAGLVVSVNTQNAAVETMKAESEKIEANVEKATAKAATVLAGTDEKVIKIMTSPERKTCSEAMNFMRESAIRGL